jgi:CheY-like chemotaxis protein
VKVAEHVAPSGKIVIELVDTGPGLSAEQQSRLFTPFDRLGAERSGVPGAGLGLAVSRRLVEAMGGSLQVVSVVGGGSTFSVELLAAESEYVAEAIGITMNREVRRYERTRSVLYIEDVASNLALVERILIRRPSVELIAAERGQLGLDTAVRRRPDLILLDLHLPDMSGEEVIARLKADRRTSGIPVVALSADATPATIARVRQLGIVDYITKPMTVTRLLGLLDGLLESSDAVSPALGAGDRRA